MPPRRHWSKEKEEVRQVVRRARTILGNKHPRRSDLTGLFYDPLSPLFGVLHHQLGWNHHKFLQFMSTSERISANNWTTAKLYDKKHPQLNVDDYMEEEEYLECWRQISVCGLPKTREESANDKVPFWKEVQAAINVVMH